MNQASDQASEQPAIEAAAAARGASSANIRTGTAGIIYVVAFITGGIVMSFEMLGSRYLNPYFGSGIYTWAALISTVLAALTLGYFLGGWLADRTASALVLGTTVVIASLYFLALPTFSDALLEFLLADIDDVRAGSLVASLAILLFPVTLLGMYSPFAIRLMLRSAERSGTVSGTVYGVSTAGSIVGTLGTTFLLIPLIGTKAITYSLGAAGLVCGFVLMALARQAPRRAMILTVFGLVAASAAPVARADTLIDESVRADMLKRPDGRVAHVESEYNDIYVTKRRSELTMSFQLKGWDYTESVTDLRDPDALVLRYSQVMTIATVYPGELKKVLMLGLGGGSISTYLGRFMPDVAIDTVEIDRKVIDVAKQYFGLRETERVRYLDGDGRVFLNRNRGLYDLILLDAYRGGFVPFHLLTKEFYTLVKQRLTPGGAVASNVHDGTKLYHSTVKTLGEVFPTLDLYPTGAGEVIAIATMTDAPDKDALASRVAALQERYNFRHPLADALRRRMDDPRAQAAQGELITDDFAPVNLYDAIGRERPKRK